MVTTHDMIDAYLARLQEQAAQVDDVQRFFLFLDDQLADLEYELSNSGYASEFYDRLLARFRAWRHQMGEEKWREVLSHNEFLNGANQNDLLYEV